MMFWKCWYHVHVSDYWIMIMKYHYAIKNIPNIGCIGAHKWSIYTCFFNPIYYPCKYQRPSCNVQFFLLYIKATRINYLVKFLSKPPPWFQPSIFQIIWIHVFILHNKKKEKISKKLRMSFSNLTFRSWLMLWNPGNAWLSTCNHYCTIYSKELFSV